MVGPLTTHRPATSPSPSWAPSPNARPALRDRLARGSPSSTARWPEANSPTDVAPTLVVDPLVGVAWLHLVVFRQLPLDEDFVPRAVDTVLNSAVAH